jgi:hypothetical protein
LVTIIALVKFASNLILYKVLPHMFKYRAKPFKSVNPYPKIVGAGWDYILGRNSGHWLLKVNKQTGRITKWRNTKLTVKAN